MTPVAPATDAERPISALSVVETLPDGFQQLTADQRTDLLFDPSCAPGIAEAAAAAAARIAAEECHVMPESAWWRASSAPGSSGSPAFDRARAALRELGEVA